MRVAFDIDGTISNNAHREKYAERKDWDTFHSLAHMDPPIKPTLAVLHALSAIGNEIEIWTARPDTYINQTIEWLDKHDIEFDKLMMRREGDWRRAYIVKLEWYLQRLPGDRHLLRAAGCIVHQVADRDLRG